MCTSFFQMHRSKGKVFTYNHFKEENIPKSTIYRIISRAENEIGRQKKPGSGQIAKIMTKRNLKQLFSDFNHQDRKSQEKAATKYKCTQQ